MYSCTSLLGSGIGTGLLGVAYFAKIHHLYYFILVQLLNGMLQVHTERWQFRYCNKVKF